MTNWTDYVKSFAKANNTTYGCALSDPACSAGYRKKFGNKKPLGKKKEKELMGMEDIDANPSKKSVDFKARKTAMKSKLNKSQVQKQLLETTGMMAEDINQYVPVQDLAGNFVPQEQMENIVMKIKEKGVRGRPKKYQTAEEARKAKIANTIAGAKRRKSDRDGMKAEDTGAGLFSGITAVVKKVGNLANKVKDTASAVVYGRNDYPPKVRNIISKYGDKNITGITIGRTPLGTPLMSALQVASGNTFSQKLENTPYDKLFHLFICVELNSKDKIVLEKNEVINAEIGCKLPKDTETKVITSSDIPQGLTLNEALEKTKERMGGNYFTYSAKDNNCQDFIVSFLTANNIGSETDKSWVKQETKVLFEGNNRLRKIANTLTDIGARVDILRQGAGIKKSANSIKGMPNAWITHTKEFAKKNNMKYNDALKDPANKASYKKGGMMDTHTMPDGTIMTGKTHTSKSKVIKKGGRFNLITTIKDIGKKAGEPFKPVVGINPFTTGFDLGHDVIGPALMGRGMPTSRDAYIAELYEQANLGANGKVRLN